MRIAPTAFSALCGKISLTGFSEIKKQIARRDVKDLRPNLGLAFRS